MDFYGGEDVMFILLHIQDSKDIPAVNSIIPLIRNALKYTRRKLKISWRINPWHPGEVLIDRFGGEDVIEVVLSPNEDEWVSKVCSIVDGFLKGVRV